MSPDPIPEQAAIESDSSVVAATESSRRSGGRIRIAVLYCVLVFAITWSICLLFNAVDDIRWHIHLWLVDFDLTKKGLIWSVSGFSPGIVAVFLGLITRWKYFPDPASQLRLPVRPKALYLFAIASPALVFVASVFALNFNRPDTFSGLGVTTLLTFLLGGVANLPFAPLWEEPGWRGCLLPLLSPRFGFWGSALITGAIWGVWHLPDFPLSGQFPLRNFLVFCVATTGMSMVLAALYKAGGNSLRLPILFHASWNAMSQAMVPMHSNLGPRQVDCLAVGVWLLALFCWLWWSGQNSDTSANPPL